MIKNFRIVLDTVGPVHVGDGGTYFKKELIFVPKHKKLYIMDPKKYLEV